MEKLLFGTLGLLSMSSIAVAADLPVIEAEQVQIIVESQVPDWTGFQWEELLAGGMLTSRQ